MAFCGQQSAKPAEESLSIKDWENTSARIAMHVNMMTTER